MTKKNKINTSDDDIHITKLDAVVVCCFIMIVGLLPLFVKINIGASSF